MFPAESGQRLALLERFQQQHGTGILTLLFTDLVDSTRLKQDLGDTRAVGLVQQHHARVREWLKEFRDAQEIETAGDSFLLVFARPSDAVRFALGLHVRNRQLSADAGASIQDRVGIHAGEVFVHDQAGDAKLFGSQVDLCGRVLNMATGGQVLLTRFVFDNARAVLKGNDLQGVGQLAWVSHGPYLLKGIEEAVEVCEVAEAGQSPPAAPKTSDKAQRQVRPDEEPVLGWRPAVGQEVPNTPWMLEEKLGEGGFGEVWVAQHPNLKQRRVFKFCFRADRVRALKRELTLFRLLQEHVGEHPNIVRLYEVYLEQPPFYLEEEYVEGKDLKTWCETQGGIDKVPLEVRLEIVAQAAEALQAAHDAGIIHRDVKPGNILVSGSVASGEPPTVKLTDFGIGQVISAEFLKGVTQAGFTQTMAGSTSSGTGTTMYLAPEIVAGNPATTRSDIYSLGVVLYQLLAGDFRRPVTTDWAVDISGPLLREDLRQCFVGNPRDRFAGAGQLAENLRSYAKRKTAWERESRLHRQAALRRKLVVLSSFVLAVLAALVLALGYGLGRARHAERRATAGEMRARQDVYVADMNLLQQSLRLNNLGRARILLDRHRPQPGKEDLRGWEWRYLWQLTRGNALATLTNHPAPACGFSLCFSSDGHYLAAGWTDGRVELWDVPGRRRIRVLKDREDFSSEHVAFSPVDNLLAATTEAGTVTLYDLDSGRESILWRAPSQGSWDVRDLSFSQDGSRLVVYAGSMTGPELGDAAWVVNVSSSNVESHHRTAFSWDRHFGAAGLSPDGMRLYLAHSDAENYRCGVQCVDLSTGTEIWRTAEHTDMGLTTLALSPDGRILASASGFEDSTVRIWDATDGRLLIRLDGHTGWVCKLLFTRDGRHLISAASDQTIRFWDTGTWTESRVLRGHSDEVHAVADSQPAQLMASAGKDGNLMLWRQEETSASDGYVRLAKSLRWNQVLLLEQSRATLFPEEGPPELFDLKLGAALGQLPELGSSSNILKCHYPNWLCRWDGTNRILIDEWNGSAFIRRGVISTVSKTRPKAGKYEAGVALLPGRQEAAWNERAISNSVFVGNWAHPVQPVQLHGDPVGLLPYCFSPDGSHLAAVADASGLGIYALCVWNLRSKQVVLKLDQTTDTAFAAGGRVLVVLARATGKSPAEIRFYDLGSLEKPPKCLPFRQGPQLLAVSPDGGLVAASDEGGTLRLCDPVKGELIKEWRGHLNAAFGVGFSPDGRRLASVSGGREALKLWDVATQQELLTLPGTGSILGYASWSADGNTLLVGQPYQAWSAPSWEEIEAAEKAEAVGKAK